MVLKKIENKKDILLFVVAIAFLVFATLHMYRTFDAGTIRMSFLSLYLINLPGNLMMGVIDFLIVSWVYKKVEWRGNTLRVLLDLVLASVFALLLGIIGNLIVSPSNLFNFLAKYAIPLCLWNSIMVLLIESFFYNRLQLEAEKKIVLMEKENIQYQYEMLKAQINPHFLFNSLNVLSSLAYQDAKKANFFAKKMSGIYRYLLLTNTRPIVTLKEELAFLESYVYLEKIRFEEALFIEINNQSDLSRQVIPVSLQLLVENAVKHNITTSNQPLYVRIDITDNEITVSNNLQLRYSVVKNGLGLINLQKQYTLFNKEIEIIQTETEFIVKLPFIG